MPLNKEFVIIFYWFNYWRLQFFKFLFCFRCISASNRNFGKDF